MLLKSPQSMPTLLPLQLGRRQWAACCHTELPRRYLTM